MKNKQKIGAIMFAGFIVWLPFIVSASGLVPCGGGGTPPEPPCDFSQLMVMANKIISFIIYGVAVPLAALGFMWAGADLVLNQNKEGAWSTAKERFGDIAIGFFVILGAFLLIKFILYQFLNTGAGFTLFLIR